MNVEHEKIDHKSTDLLNVWNNIDAVMWYPRFCKSLSSLPSWKPSSLAAGAGGEGRADVDRGVDSQHNTGDRITIIYIDY